MACQTYVMALVILILSRSVVAVEWPPTEIRAVGKNLTSMAGFYIGCEKQGHVRANPRAIRWSLYMGARYLFIAGIENEYQKWIDAGSMGQLVEDPTKSEDMIQINFAKSTCESIKNLLDARYESAASYIEGGRK